MNLKCRYCVFTWGSTVVKLISNLVSITLKQIPASYLSGDLDVIIVNKNKCNFHTRSDCSTLFAKVNLT